MATYLPVRSAQRQLSDMVNPAYSRGLADYIRDLKCMGITAEVQGSVLFITQGKQIDQTTELPSHYLY